MGPLIDAESLLDILERVRVCDLRWDLTDRARGRDDYLAGHIPRAVFVDLDEDLAAPPSTAGRHPLPEADDFVHTLGRLGISNDTHVVAYDAMGGRIAARLWWMLRSIGHNAVQVLDGGYQAWRDAGLPVEVGAVESEPTTYRGPVSFHGIATADDLDGKTVIDARVPERYRGDFEPVDPRAGHVPGALNIPTEANLAESGRFHDPITLSRVYGRLTGEVVVSCGSGVHACHDALAMVVAGMEMPQVYVGSFSQWSRSDRPVAVGSDP